MFQNSLGPDQARKNAGPDLHPNCFDTMMEFIEDLLKKFISEKKIAAVYKDSQRLERNASLLIIILLFQVVLTMYNLI